MYELEDQANNWPNNIAANSRMEKKTRHAPVQGEVRHLKNKTESLNN